MKVLSIRQPWAWLIVNAESYPDPKRIENRTWSTGFRGDLLIHAGKAFDRSGYESVIAVRPELANVMPAPDKFERGGIVGAVHLHDCVTDSNSMWYTGDFGFVLRNARPLPFYPMRGMLGFFDAPADFKVTT